MFRETALNLKVIHLVLFKYMMYNSAGHGFRSDVGYMIKLFNIIVGNILDIWTFWYFEWIATFYTSLNTWCRFERFQHFWWSNLAGHWFHWVGYQLPALVNLCLSDKRTWLDCILSSSTQNTALHCRWCMLSCAFKTFLQTIQLGVGGIQTSVRTNASLICPQQMLKLVHVYCQNNTIMIATGWKE